MADCITVSIVEPEAVGRVAKIVGDSSAATAALTEYRKRIATGERVAIFQGGRSWFVGPDPRPVASGIVKGG